MTIRDMGLTKAVKEGNYNVIDRGYRGKSCRNA